MSPSTDGVLQRLIRNYRGINLLNQHKANEAAAVLASTMPPVAEDLPAQRQVATR